MFNIDYITILPGCHYTKNLTENHPYRFNMGLEENFFGKNINVHAIVGKNGSGKSSLLEIMFRLINNLSFCLLENIPRNAADDIRYSFGLYAEMGWTIDGKKGVLRCKDTCVTLEREGLADVEYKVDERAGATVFSLDYDYSDEYDRVKNVSDNFFYTIVLNYSMQSYVAQDYVGEECKSKTSNRHKSWNVDDVWINALFHKNDGYMCPINLNPYRDEGHINMNKEMILTRERVASLLEYFKQEGKSLIDGYVLKEVNYTFDLGKVNGYFNSDMLVDLENQKFPTTDEKVLKSRQDTKDNDSSKAERIKSLFKFVLQSKEQNISKAILEHYGIDTSVVDRSYALGMIYLVCKILNIGLVYPKYLLLTEKGTAYTYWDALAEASEDSKINTVNTLLKNIDEEDSHITLKVKRAVKFLQNYKNIKAATNNSLEYVDENMGFNGSEYRKGLGISGVVNLTLKEIEDSLPISIFKQHVYLLEVGDNKLPKSEPIELCRLSSGERQYVFSLSSLVYHLTNLLSVKDGNPKYHNFNIIIDELEICMHPDYQRQFLSKMLNLLSLLGLNNEPLNLNILFCTHSPFALSDIPQQNILYLKDGKDYSDRVSLKTFGANVHDLLHQSFFMENGFTGEMARKHIDDLAKYLNGAKDSVCPCSEEKIEIFIEMVGDPIVRQQLYYLYDSYLYKKQTSKKQDRINKLKAELAILEGSLGNEKNTNNATD